MTNERIQNIVKECVENIDYNKIKKVMNSLNWTWLDEKESPSIKRLKNTARQLIVDSIEGAIKNEDYYFSSTGGFMAQAFYSKKDDKISAQIIFEIESYEFNEFEDSFKNFFEKEKEVKNFKNEMDFIEL